jgi:hypothetical protein
MSNWERTVGPTFLADEYGLPKKCQGIHSLNGCIKKIISSLPVKIETILLGDLGFAFQA